MAAAIATPASITRAELLELPQSLGLPTDDLRDLFIYHAGVEAVYYARNDEGQRYVVPESATSEAVTYTVFVPCSEGDAA